MSTEIQVFANVVCELSHFEKCKDGMVASRYQDLSFRKFDHQITLKTNRHSSSAPSGRTIDTYSNSQLDLAEILTFHN